MKFKHRALAIMLTLMMVLTYMPALAFADDEAPADPEGSRTWDAYTDFPEAYLNDEGYVDLYVATEFYEGQPNLEYSWFDEEGNLIEGEVSGSYRAVNPGYYYCMVSEADNPAAGEVMVEFNVYPYESGGDDDDESSWWAWTDISDVELDEGEATLTVLISYDGEEPDLTYTWSDKNGTLDESGKSITVYKAGRYICNVTDGNRNDEVWFYVYGDKYWELDPYYKKFYVLPNGSTDIELNIDVFEDDYYSRDMDVPSFEYQWFKEGDDGYTEIGNTSNFLGEAECGDYKCVVTDSYGNAEEAHFYIEELNTSGGWYAYPKDGEDDVNLSADGKATLEVVAEPYSEDTLPDELTYTWYIDAEDDGEDTVIEGATGSSVVVTETGGYYCLVSDGNEENDRTVNFYVNDMEYADIDWYLETDRDNYLVNGSANLVVDPDYWGDGTPTYKYQWYDNIVYDDEGHEISATPIAGETSAKYIAKKAGEYKCEVTITVNGQVDRMVAGFTVYDWWITNDEKEIPAEYGKPLTLKAETNYKGEEPITYQWYTLEYEYDEEDDEEYEHKVPIEGATEASYEIESVTESGDYLCEVTIGGATQTGWYYVWIDTRNYVYEVTYPNAVATFKTADGKPVTVTFEDGDASSNIYQEGNTVTMTSGSHVDVYTCDEDGSFINVEGEYLDIYYDSELVDAAVEKMEVGIRSDRETDHENKKITRKYDADITLPVKVITEVKSISFAPASISVYSEDVKETYDGHTYYDLNNRYRYKDPRGYEENDTFLKGDKLTVTYNNGTTRVYTFDPDEGFVYKTGDAWYWASRPQFNRYSLNAGNNALKILYMGRSAAVNVFMDTPALRAERTANAEWNGVLNTKIPAAKKVKVKAASKKATVTWTKANKKNLKKFDKIEIQISNNKQFDRKNPLTKRFVISKSKKNYTIKKLKKGTYFVRVRHVKGTGASKQVSKWSTAKKVKIKK